MGPTTAALLRFFQADQAFREANVKLEAATRDVRTQEARVSQLKAEHDATHRRAVEAEAKSKEIDAELKSREARIELLRDRQNTATDDKAYRALIVEINTNKLDKGKFEEQGLAAIDALEALKKTQADLKSRGDNEGAKLATMHANVGDKVKALQAEVDELKGPRDEALHGVPPAAMTVYQRASARYDGEAMAALEKPDVRDIEYLCSGCNTYLVANIYNRLMSSKDELVPCPSCSRVLYVPTELTPELALQMKLARVTGGAKKAKVAKAPKLNEDGTEKPKRAPRVKKPKEAGVGKAQPEAGSVAAAIGAGRGAARGRGFAAKGPTAPSAPPSTRADGSVHAEDSMDEDAVEATADEAAS